MALQHHDPHMQSCIEACTSCSETCLGMAMTHCLSMGGKHLEPQHFRLMIACAEMCRASAAIMLTDADIHVHSCRACAEICEACAASCDMVGEMDKCAAACRRCAEACRAVTV